MNRKSSKWAVLLVAIAMLISACTSQLTPQASPNPAPKPADPKIMTLGIWSSPDSFGPLTNRTSYGAMVLGLIYPTLTALDEKLKHVSRLAEKWQVNDRQDTFTFDLRKDAVWSDGKPMTAHDVAYTLQVIAHPDTPTTRRSLIDTLQGVDGNGVSLSKDFSVSGIKVLSDSRIQFTTKSPVTTDAFMEMVAAGVNIMPKHVLEPAVTADIKGLDKAEHIMNPKVVGGPFTFVAYTADSHIELAPNKSYFLGSPKVDKLFIKIAGQASFAAAIEKGEIDATTGTALGEVPVADWERVSTLTTVVPYKYAAPAFQFLDINTSRPEFSKAAVRQAFAHAINRPLIVQRLMKGQGEVINTPLTSINKYFVKELQSKLEYDKEKAKQMLTAAGWDWQQEVVIMTPAGNLVREQSAEIIAANLVEIGVKAKIEKVDVPTRQSRMRSGQFQLTLAGISSTFDPDFSALVATGGIFNDRNYSNKQLDSLLAQGKLAMNESERQRMYTEAQTLFVAEVPFLPLYSIQSLNVTNKRVVGYKAGPHSLGGTFNAHEWDVLQ